MSSDNTPAIQAHLASIGRAQAGDREGWLALFAEDCVVHDPVGTSAHDPEGKGFHGHAGLGQFWDMMIGLANLVIVSHRRIPCGDNVCACLVTATNDLEGLKTYTEMIVTYEVNDAGLIVSLRAYWDTQATMAQLAAQGVEL